MFKHLAIGVLALAAALPSAAATPRKTLGDLVREGRREAVMAAITPPQIDVNEKAPDGSTALMWAVFNVDHEMVHALLKAGARANVANNYGASALTEAIKVNDLELVRLLLDAGADVDSPNLDGQTALMLAISVGSPQIARLLIARGADVNALEQFRSQNALMWAAGGNMPEIVELLLAKGAKNVDLRAKYDDWPRQQTSEPRAQYQSRQTGGLTALLYATRSGCLRCAVALVKAGADVNKPNPDGVTPLINALDNRRFDVAMFLLDKGANPHVWDMSGRTPLYLAVDMNSFRGGGGFGGGPGGGVNAGGIGGVVGGPGAPQGPPPAQREPGPQPLDVARRLIDMGVDVNHQLTRKRPYGPGRGRFADYDMRGGVGALFVATLSHDHEAMQLLLAHGAEVDLPNVFQMTPLMIAAGMRGTGRAGGGGGGPGGGDPQARAIRSIDLLLDAGANINTRVTDSRTHTAVLMAYVAGRDQEGRTALFAAAEGGMDKVVKHLLERGADPSIRDAAGKTALDIARAPAPAGAGGGAAGPSPAASGRAAVVTLLEAVTPKAPAGGDTISAR